MDLAAKKAQVERRLEQAQERTSVQKGRTIGAVITAIIIFVLAVLFQQTPSGQKFVESSAGGLFVVMLLLSVVAAGMAHRTAKDYRREEERLRFLLRELNDITE